MSVSVTQRVVESVDSFGGRGVSLKRPVLESVSVLGGWGVSLTSPVLETVWSYVGWGVYLAHPVLASVSSFSEWKISMTCAVKESVLSISGCGESFNALCCNVSSFVGRGVSTIRPVIESVSFWLGGEFLLHAPCGNLSGRTSGTESMLHAPF